MARAGRADEALARLDQAQELAERTGQRFMDPEFHRVRGETLLVRSADDTAAAKAEFDRALVIARAQSAKSWELRAATSLARLWGESGKREEARDLLAPVYGWFTEGFDTPDLKDTKTLLDSLA